MKTTLLIGALCAGPCLSTLRAAPQHDHDHGHDEPAAVAPGDLVPLERGGPPSRERFTDWAERDGEGRWALWAHDLRMRGPDAVPAWVPFLIAEREGELLERLALTQTSFEAADALWKLGAPNAMRATAWLLADRENRTRNAARAALEQRSTAFLAWEAAHRDAATAETRALAAELREARGAAGAPPATPREAAPLGHAELYGALAGARACEPFGNRLRGDEGVVYDQAVLRAVATAQGRPDGGGPSVRGALLEAARSQDEMVARLSMLAFTHMTPTLVPVPGLGALAEDPSLPGALRDVALLCASYGAWPAASIYLHRHAFGDPGASTWRVAWNRLVERGDPYTLARAAAEPLGKPGTDGTADEPASFRDERLRTLEERLDSRRTAAGPDSRAWLVQSAAESLERLALATLWDDPQRALLEDWTFDVLEGPDDDLRSHLAELGRSYASELEPEDPAARSVVEDFVRQWARDLTADEQGR